MNSPDSLGRDALAYTFGGTLQLLGNLALLPILTNVLNDEQFGLTVTLQLIVQLCVHVSSSGLPGATTREHFVADVGPDRSRRLVATAAPMALIATTLLAASSVIWVNVFDSLNFNSTVLITVMVALPRAITAAALGLLRAIGQVRGFLQISIVNTVGAQLLGVLSAVVFSPSARTYITGYLAGSVIACIGAWTWCLQPTQLLKGSALRNVLKYALPTVPHAIATLVLQAGDRVVIERTLGLAEVGRYQVAYLLASLPIPAVVSFNNAWTPRMAAAREKGMLVPSLERTGSVLLVAVPCIGAAGAIMAPAAVAWLMPASYASDELRSLCSWISTVAVLFTLYVIASQVLFAERRTVLQAAITITCAVANISLNLLLVPRYDLEGAAIATAITYLAMSTATTLAAQRRARYRLSPRSIVLGLVMSGYGFTSIVVPAGGIAGLAIRSVLVIPPAILGIAALRTLSTRVQT